MTIRTLVDLILFGNAGLWVVATLIGLRGANAPYLRPSQSRFVLSPSGLVFRQPWEKCIFLGLIGFLCLLMPLVVATNDLSLYGTVLPSDWPHLWAFVGIGLAGAVFFWWVGRPTEIAVDEDRRTYRWSKGWFPFRWVRTGPLSDLFGVGAIIGGGSAYFVYIGGPGGAGKMVVGGFSSAEGAEYYADELALVLGVPRLVPGACQWPRSTRQRQQANAEAVHVRPTYRRCWRYPPRLRADESSARTVRPGTNEGPVD